MTTKTIVAVDARPLTGVGNGISRFLFETLKELADVPELEFVLFSNKPLHPANDLPHRTVIDHAWSKMPGSLWLLTRLNRLALRYKATVIWGGAHVLPFRHAKLVSVLTVHDLVYRVMPQSMARRNRFFSKILVERSIRQADTLVADSRSTRDDIGRLLGLDTGPIAVIHLAGARRSNADLSNSRSGREAGISPFLFALGSIEPRKNIDGLLASLPFMLKRRPNLKLRLAGADSWGSSETLRRITRPDEDAAVTFLGFIDDEAVQKELQRSAAFVMPSHYEGFGLPVIESTGLAPIITSDIPMFRELGEFVDGICYVDFTKPAVAADKIIDFLDGNPPVARFSAGAEDYFIWHRVAADYARILLRSGATQETALVS